MRSDGDNTGCLAQNTSTSTKHIAVNAKIVIRLIIAGELNAVPRPTKSSSRRREDNMPANISNPSRSNSRFFLPLWRKSGLGSDCEIASMKQINMTGTSAKKGLLYG